MYVLNLGVKLRVKYSKLNAILGDVASRQLLPNSRLSKPICTALQSQGAVIKFQNQTSTHTSYAQGHQLGPDDSESFCAVSLTICDGAPGFVTLTVETSPGVSPV